MIDLSLHLFKCSLSHFQYQSIPRTLRQRNEAEVLQFTSFIPYPWNNIQLNCWYLFTKAMVDPFQTFFLLLFQHSTCKNDEEKYLFQVTEENLENNIVSSIPNCLAVNKLAEESVTIHCKDRRIRKADYHHYSNTYSLRSK